MAGAQCLCLFQGQAPHQGFGLFAGVSRFVDLRRAPGKRQAQAAEQFAAIRGAGR